MGNRRVPKLVYVETESVETDRENGKFMEYLKNALILALLDMGVLNPGQYQYAYKKLEKERNRRGIRMDIPRNSQ